MGLFDKYHDEITAYLKRKISEGEVSEFCHQGGSNWPLSKNRNLVLGQDTAVELGNPKDASTSFLLWCNKPNKVNNGRISIVGPDLLQIKSKQVSFGKIVIVTGVDFNAENSYERYRALEKVRFDIHLKGYMMRGASQFQREWSRVSKEALANGFSFRILGGALIEKYLDLDFVRAVEVIFITNGRDDVLEMKTVSDQVMRIIGAMNKMAGELSFDCDTCEYTDVCRDVAELRSMRSSRARRRAVNG
jgi:CO dehydrogenase/acetyl-CoA synthase beta subunit